MGRNHALDGKKDTFRFCGGYNLKIIRSINYSAQDFGLESLRAESTEHFKNCI